jgi:hypothetical protein
MPKTQKCLVLDDTHSTELADVAQSIEARIERLRTEGIDHEREPDEETLYDEVNRKKRDKERLRAYLKNRESDIL